MKPFAWSYSKAKNFVTCPKRNYEVDIAKNFTDSTEQLDWGNEVHDAMAKACQGIPLPDSMKDWQKWADEMKDYPGRPGRLLVEQKLAISKDLTATAWFANNAWFRGVVDAARLDGDVGIARDWKTGKVLQDSRQLMLMAQCLFAHHPQLKHIKTEFVWLKDDCATHEWFHRNTIYREWPPVLDIVRQMEDAARTMSYPPKPSRLCARHCPVISCPFHGKRHT